MTNRVKRVKNDKGLKTNPNITSKIITHLVGQYD